MGGKDTDGTQANTKVLGSDCLWHLVGNPLKSHCPGRWEYYLLTSNPSVSSKWPVGGLSG